MYEGPICKDGNVGTSFKSLLNTSRWLDFLFLKGHRLVFFMGTKTSLSNWHGGLRVQPWRVSRQSVCPILSDCYRRNARISDHTALARGIWKTRVQGGRWQKGIPPSLSTTLPYKLKYVFSFQIYVWHTKTGYVLDEEINLPKKNLSYDQDLIKQFWFFGGSRQTRVEYTGGRSLRTGLSFWTTWTIWTTRLLKLSYPHHIELIFWQQVLQQL